MLKKQLTKRVAADEGKLIGKASVLKAWRPESLIKRLPMLLASLGEGNIVLLAQQLSVLLLTQT